MQELTGVENSSSDSLCSVLFGFLGVFVKNIFHNMVVEKSRKGIKQGNCGKVKFLWADFGVTGVEQNLA